VAAKFGKLTALTVQRLKAPGLYGDGAGLWLKISPAGTKSWVFRFMVSGKARSMGLGPLAAASLSDARQKAQEARRLILGGADPLEIRRASKALQAANAMTFEQCTQACIASYSPSWRNPKHRQQWTSTMKTYVYPLLGKLPVGAVAVEHVMKVLEPIWTEKPETAARVRGRIEAILDWATALGYRNGENPARWKGHLANLLPARLKVRRVKHHAALPYDQIAKFMADLRVQEGVSARAFEFAILTACRTSEAIRAAWDEINFETNTWTIPGERIKAGKEHRVPLSSRSIAILQEMLKIRQGPFVFPGGRKNQPLSTMAFLMTLRRMKRTGITAHGFRSTFRDWCAEQTNFSREVAEMSLAHAIGDKVEAAYRRGDLFEKRRQLMDAWAGYCGHAR
jgi:integrase